MWCNENRGLKDCYSENKPQQKLNDVTFSYESGKTKGKFIVSQIYVNLFDLSTELTWRSRKGKHTRKKIKKLLLPLTLYET